MSRQIDDTNKDLIIQQLLQEKEQVTKLIREQSEYHAKQLREQQIQNELREQQIREQQIQNKLREQQIREQQIQNEYLQRCLLERQTSNDQIDKLFNGDVFTSESSEVSANNFLYDAGGKPILQDELLVSRKGRIVHLVNSLHVHGSILVRSPPFSGKSWLCYLMNLFLKQAHQQSCYIPMLRFDSTRMSLDEYFAQYTGKSLDEWIQMSNNKNDKKVYILIDEAQTLYSINDSHLLWRCIKESLEYHYNSETDSFAKGNLHFLLFSSYGERPGAGHYSTPVAFPDNSIFDLQCLLMDNQDCTEMFEKYNHLAGDILPYPPAIQSKILYLCNYSIGLVRKTIYAMYKYMHNHWRVELSKPGNCDLSFRSLPNYNEILHDYLYSYIYHITISDCRFVPDRPYTDVEKHLFRTLLLHSFLEYHDASVSYGSECVKSLVKQGLLMVSNDMLQFPAPVVRFMIIQKILRVYGSPQTIIPSMQLKNDGLFQFVCKVFSFMRPSFIRHELSLGADKRPLERVWQMEFYRASSYILHHTEYVHVDFDDRSQRANDKTTRYLDFYVNHKLRWGLEFMREGIDITGHLARFFPGGQYFPFMNKLDEYYVIDFRSGDKKIRKSFGPRVIHVSYTSNFESVSITHSDHLSDSIQLSLMGDFQEELKVV